MIVGQILGAKTQSQTVTIAPSATIKEAVTLLSEKRIGALVVASAPGKPVGILSERDVVRELGREGPEVLESRVDALMTSKLVTCRKDHSALDVLDMMTKGRFRHLPVMDGGEMVGLVSIGDVVKARLDELAMEKDALEGMIMGH
ncbi:CBS domain-containing protein [Celeribacter sp.]|uniref:CBS domain-containing protein n=1 Tax=Celeribacter sp. TaxID=1890673 RepID=UPI003A951D14